MEAVIALLIPIVIPVCICVVLPVMIVHLVTRARQNETNKKTEIMLKAIESGATIDADFFKNTQKKQKRQKSPANGQKNFAFCG